MFTENLRNYLYVQTILLVKCITYPMNYPLFLIVHSWTI